MDNFLNVDVIVGTYDSMICGLSYDLLTDTPTFRRTFSDKGHTASVRSLASFNQYLVSGSADETIGYVQSNIGHTRYLNACLHA